MSLTIFEKITLLVPAAGRGTRMGQTGSPKALTLFQGRELITWATSAFVEILDKAVIVIREEHKPAFDIYLQKLSKPSIKFAYQPNSSGTAYAVMNGLREVDSEWVVSVWGDHIGACLAPALELFAKTGSSDADFFLPIVYREKPYVYFNTNELGVSLEFCETKYGAQVQDFGYSDCGFFIFKSKPVLNYLLNNLQGESDDFSDEVNFLALFTQMEKSGIVFEKIIMEDPRISFGINSQEDLLQSEKKFELRNLNAR
jgi:bifunctional N-acetylglucosamine-1-phosphate-uridyltransferase/glucosamine-1-phosphate-acetyltransferase GlmU-like protein